MRPRVLAGAVLLSLLSSSVRAEFCLLNGKKDGEPEIYELGGPRCGGGNRLVFTRRYGIDRVSQDAETFLTDSWPGFMGADQKCRDAEKGARVVVDRPGSIIVGMTYGSRIGFNEHQVWAFKGSCSSFRSQFMAARREAPGKEWEDLLDSIKAGKSSMGELISALIEQGQKPAQNP